MIWFGRREFACSALIAVTLAAAGCGGGGSSTEGDISHVVEKWATAYATQDPGYCAYEPRHDQKLCRNYLAGGQPTVYQTGYLNAKVEGIDLTNSTKGVVTLSNGCKVEVADEGGGDWRVTNSGGSLANGCEQGVGR
jgi:hypothetical protein